MKINRLLFTHWALLLIVNAAVGLLPIVIVWVKLSLQPLAFAVTNFTLYEPIAL